MIADAVLVWTAGAIALFALGVGVLTLVTSVWIYYVRRRNERVQGNLRPELFERLFADDPDWDAWVSSLSRVERGRLRILLDEYLRKLRGTEHSRLRGLASALGITARAERNVERGRHRFRALTWLALLKEPVDPDLLVSSCTVTPRLRAGAARVLHESEHPDAAAIGTELVVDGDSLTAFGLDTLYRLNNGTETPLLTRLAEAVDDWDERLLVQVLIVLRYCDIADPDGRLDWLPPLLSHDSPRVRAAAVGVVERHGWREAFQSRIDIGRLLDDSEAAVRHDTYLLLSSWNTDRSAAWLRWALTEADDADGLALARAHLSHPRTDVSNATQRLEPFVDWVLADEAVGRRRRVWGVSAAWS
ncbi:HEAT repeat domain-containing protein [Halobellus sp. GM3]|uniref:HEAT repeat domain-containing protein n=1 Tax=Halobellus sp. GM3 TaxID=3458410 RepID=UPI00403E0B77